MDWIKQNKFLSGWLAVTLLVAAALGYLLFSAKSAYAEKADEFTGKVGELQNLQNATPYPDEENFKKMQELQKAHQAAIDDLQKKLAKTEFPVVPLSAVKFQDELRESVRRVTTLATERGTKLPEKFYMGMEKYQAEPPKDEAAAPLGRVLKAMEEALNILIESGAESIGDIKRDPLPEEGGAPASGATPPKQPGGKSTGSADSDLVKKNTFAINFVAAEPKFRRFLNSLISDEKQFYVPNNIVVANEKTTGPPKVTNQTPFQDPNAPKKSDVQFVVGSEKLAVAMKIDIVDFAEPIAAK